MVDWACKKSSINQPIISFDNKIEWDDFVTTVYFFAIEI